MACKFAPDRRSHQCMPVMQVHTGDSAGPLCQPEFTLLFSPENDRQAHHTKSEQRSQGSQVGQITDGHKQGQHG